MMILQKKIFARSLVMSYMFRKASVWCSVIVHRKMI